MNVDEYVTAVDPYGDMLNGGFAGPQIATVDETEAQKPSDVKASLANGGSPAVILAFMILFAVLVITHVLTLSVQR